MISLILAQALAPTNAPKPVVSTPPAPPLPLFILPTAEQVYDFGSSLVMSLVIIGLIYAIVFYGLRILLRRLEKEIFIVTLNISQIPLLIILALFSLKTAFRYLGSAVIFRWIDKGLTAFMVVAAAYWLAQLFTQVIAYYLKKYAQQSEATWDDVLIPILESTAPLVIYLFGTFLFLQSFDIDLTGLWVAFGGATFVLGFALKDILANFFSGLVLLIDSPFQFGDVISMPDGSIAVIKKIGIRLTNLFLIDTHCELFVPNGNLQAQNIINLSRPAPHYYYSINLPLRADAEPSKAMKIIREVVLAHPDTLGSLDEKLEVLDRYYKFTDETEYSQHKQSKKEAGHERLTAELNLNNLILKIEQSFVDLESKIQMLEKGGLEAEETRKIQGYFLDIVKMTGLELVKERQGKRRLASLEEAPDLENTLIGAVRTWYRAWSNDPDLTEEDPLYLQEEWERKIQLLKMRMNKLFQKISQPSMDETRLDDYVITLARWLNERFKNTQTLWQVPKIWTSAIHGDGTMASMEYIVKFYIDNIKLEQCQRGNRIKSEVQGELIRQLRQVYIYR